MRTCRTILAALAAAVLLPSCEILDDKAGNDEGRPCELTVNLAGAVQTKGAATAAEDKVNDLQILVFRGDDLDAYAQVYETSSATLSCTAGPRTVYAVVNAPSLSSITSVGELEMAVSRLQDNSRTNLVMIGSRSADVPSSVPVTVEVSRIASRIILNKITRDFSAPALVNQFFRIDKVFVSNAAGDVSYSLSSTPSIWYNTDQTSTDLPLLLSTSPSATLYNADSYSTPLTFYTYPNNGSQKVTRLVVQATLGSKTMYYPIEIPTLVRNTSYEIPELIITRPGSDSPQTPVSSSDVNFTITVKDWTVNSMAKEII